MRDKDDPAVRAYLEQENARTEKALAGTTGDQETLYQEILERIKQTDLSVPYRQGDHVYYSIYLFNFLRPIVYKKVKVTAAGPMDPIMKKQ